MPVPDYIFLKVSVLKKALSILPKKEKDIELLHFHSRTDPYSSETVIIRYRFKNALWYCIDNKRTTESRHILVRPANADEKHIHLTVQGLFRKNKYEIELVDGDAYITELSQN